MATAPAKVSGTTAKRNALRREAADPNERGPWEERTGVARLADEDTTSTFAERDAVARFHELAADQD